MKRIFSLLLMAALGFTTLNAQQVSMRAKALRYKAFAREAYGVTDVKIVADTMVVYAVSEQVMYPFGKFDAIDDYVNSSALQWYREVGYKRFFGDKEVSVNTLKRLDGTFLDLYCAINTRLVDVLDSKITDPEVALSNGLRVGSTKEEVFLTYFSKYLKSYVSDVNVLKVTSASGEVSEIYTFRGKKLRHIQVRSDYRYY